jgi:hypothetical protein
MQSVRIDPRSDDTVKVDIQCECGNNMLTDADTNRRDISWAVATGNEPDLNLICSCGRKFQIHSQRGHVHVFSMQ